MKRSDIWYANEAKHRSLTKVIVYSDIGLLNANDGVLEFVTPNRRIVIDKLQTISLTRQRMPIVSWLLILPFYSVFLMGTHFFIKSFFGVGFYFTFCIFAILLLFGLHIGLATKWVEVEHQNESGSMERSYFADGYRHGWRGVFGGTERLYRELKKNHM